MSDGARRPAFVWSGATTLILTGATAAWMYLGSIASLWSSAYGRMLSAKLLLFIGVASCGYPNWRHLHASSPTGETDRRMDTDVTHPAPQILLEVVLATAVVLVTAVLTELAHP